MLMALDVSGLGSRPTAGPSRKIHPLWSSAQSTMATKEEAAQAAEGRVNVPIGYRYGYPAFHLFSGNLPVVTPALHKPRKVPVDGVSAAELNLVSSDASGALLTLTRLFHFRHHAAPLCIVALSIS